MEDFVYTLKDNQPKNYKRQKWLFILLGILYIVNGSLRYYEAKGDTAFNLIYLLTGVLMLLGGVFENVAADKFMIKFAKDGITFNKDKVFTGGKDFFLPWNKVDSYHLAPIRIEIKSIDGKLYSIPLDSLGFHDVQLVKSKFNEFVSFYKK